MKTNKIIYWVTTGLMCALMLMSASMYFMNTEEIQKAFLGWGYPAYIVIPLAIAKILGIVAILTKKSTLLKEWAYAGFFFDMVLAAVAHLDAGDGQYIGAIGGIVLLVVSRFYENKIIA